MRIVAPILSIRAIVSFVRFLTRKFDLQQKETLQIIKSIHLVVFSKPAKLQMYLQLPYNDIAISIVLFINAM